MKDQVMTINSVQKSSKSELSSGTFGHFKVLQFCSGGWLAARQTKKQNEHCHMQKDMCMNFSATIEDNVELLLLVV